MASPPVQKNDGRTQVRPRHVDMYILVRHSLGSKIPWREALGKRSGNHRVGVTFLSFLLKHVSYAVCGLVDAGSSVLYSTVDEGQPGIYEAEDVTGLNRWQSFLRLRRVVGVVLEFSA